MHHSTYVYNHFYISISYGAKYHDTILNRCIDILPYRYVLQILTLRVCVCVCVYAYVSVYMHTQVSSSVIEYVEIYHRRGIFDEHLRPHKLNY